MIFSLASGEFPCWGRAEAFDRKVFTVCLKGKETVDDASSDETGFLDSHKSSNSLARDVTDRKIPETVVPKLAQALAAKKPSYVLPASAATARGGARTHDIHDRRK